MPNYLGNKALSHLNTKYYYSSLNEGYNNCQDEAFYNEAKEKLEDYHWLQDVSEQILNGLCYVYRNSLKHNFEKDICKFFYFWLGNILFDKMSHNTVFFDVIHDLFDTLKKNSKGNICELPHFYMDVKNFKEIKLFFDYSIDYDTYKYQLSGYNPSCNREYKTYLDKYVNSYKKVKVECAENQNPNGYCREFRYYFNDKDVVDLSNMRCDLQEHGHEEEEFEEEEEEEEAEGSIISAGAGMGVHPVINQNEIPNVTREGEKGPGFSGYISSEINSDLNSVSDPSDDSSTSTIKKSITSAVSAAGVLVPPFLIYNYAPARSWINKLLGINKGPNRNPYGNQELMADFSMPEDFNSERNRYNIMYRPE